MQETYPGRKSKTRKFIRYFVCMPINIQLGVALGFLLPPVLVKDGTIEEIGSGLSLMFYIVAGLCTAVSILVIVGISIRNNSN